MTWTPAARNYLLQTLENFRDRYCEIETLARMQDAAAPAELFEARLASLRRVVSRLTELMPALDHSTPDWNTPRLPVIVVGRMRADGRVNDIRRIGLCATGGQLYVWVDARSDAPAALRMDLGNGLLWHPWIPPDNGKPGLWRYAVPVDLFGNGAPPPDHPLAEGHPLCTLLAWVNEQALAGNNGPVCARLAPHRMPQELPATTQVVYPALLRRAYPR
mgnify:CR=1 FL=1